MTGIPVVKMTRDELITALVEADVADLIFHEDDHVSLMHVSKMNYSKYSDSQLASEYSFENDVLVEVV